VDSGKIYWAAFAGLALLNLLIIGTAGFIPGHDIPMHLAYVRILAGYSDPLLPFQDIYQLAPSYQPYFISYRIMTALVPLAGVTGALKVYLALYALLFQWGIARLADAVGGTRQSWIGLAGAALVWNPIQMMGFLTMLLALAILVHSLAFLMETAREPGNRRNRTGLAVCGALLTSVHIAAAGFFVLYLLLYGLARSERAFWKVLAPALGAVIAMQAFWTLTGDTGAGGFKEPLSAAWQDGAGLNVITERFGLVWNPLTMKLNMVMWTLLGPWRMAGLLFSAVTIAGAVTVTFLHRSPGGANFDFAPGFLRYLGLLSAMGLLLPMAIQRPNEIFYFDTRHLVLMSVLAVCSMPPVWFRNRTAKLAAAGAVLLLVLHTGYRVHAFMDDARPLLELIEKRKPKGLVSVYAFRDFGTGIAQEMRVTHYLPMYHTVFNGGKVAQFWGGKYANMPVSWKPEKQPPPAADFMERIYKDTELVESDWLLVQQPEPGGLPLHRTYAHYALQRIPEFAKKAECRGDWCLYRIDREKLLESLEQPEPDRDGNGAQSPEDGGGDE